MYPWTPRSPDLTPADFWLWGLKSCVYLSGPSSLSELKDAIRRAVSSIHPDMLNSSVAGFVTRLKCLLPCDGGHVEHILVEIVTLDLLGPYPASRPERYRFLLEITDHFTKWSKLIPLRKASGLAIANTPFENYISRYGAPNSLSSDNGPQFISEVFEHLSHRMDIKHMKTVTYRPQVNLTERINRNLVQMIARFVEENHKNWNRFLNEFAFALRTSVNETTNKTPAELFLSRKIITHFSKLINVTEGAEYVGRNIEKLFVEARQNMWKQHKTIYYNRKRREVNIKVNDLVLVQTHFISAAGRRVVGRFIPKFEGPYRVLEVRNNLIILKKGKRVTVNIDQVRVYRPRQCDTISSDSHLEALYEGQRSSNGSSRSHPGKFKVSRKISSEESNGHKSRRPNNPSQGSQSIAGPSHPKNSRQHKPPTEGSRHEGSVQYDKARETKKTKNGINRAAERRPVRSKQATAVRPCPYYLRSRVRQPEGFPEERRNIGIEIIPQNKIRRRRLSMDALDGFPVDRSE
ncbi:retrovirus-related Pol polyprotein from transposon 412 [Trichonephila clavipes]|nr:retrovirus-related Pol polyprotein from transposon 412 [Trichonephila clavipes]